MSAEFNARARGVDDRQWAEVWPNGDIWRPQLAALTSAGTIWCWAIFDEDGEIVQHGICHGPEAELDAVCAADRAASEYWG